MKTQEFIFLSIIFAIILSACAGSDMADQPDLEGATWVLTSYNQSHPIEGTQLTIRFEGDQISGNAGCNHYGGSYQIKGNMISFNDLFNTEMACIEPVGVMEQEHNYLELLRSAQRFELIKGLLTIFTSSQQILSFETQQASPITPTLSPEQPAPVTPPPTVEPSDPPPTSFPEPPAGFREYRDSVVGVSVYIPESWVVTGVIDGQQAVFQSYPTNKYIGGEMLEPGDTKCDLNVRPSGTSIADLIQQWKSAPTSTLISEAEIVLQSRQPGIRIELDSMGRSVSVLTEVNKRVVVLTCFGDFASFDEIAFTLKGSE